MRALPDGTAVRAGADTIVDIYSMHRHPGLWRDAETWLPGRWLEGESTGSTESAASSAAATSPLSSTTTTSPPSPSSPCPFATAPAPAPGPASAASTASTPSAPSVPGDATADKSTAAFMPFGSGARACLGRGFAYAESQVLLAALLCEFDVAPVPGHTPQVIDGLLLTSANGLPVCITPRRAL
jgi:cytochrome P450